MCLKQRWKLAYRIVRVCEGDLIKAYPAAWALYGTEMNWQDVYFANVCRSNRGELNEKTKTVSKL